MRSPALFRPLLLACLSCAWILPTALAQENKPVNITAQGYDELKQNGKKEDITHFIDGQVKETPVVVQDLMKGLLDHWAYNQDSLASWTGAYGINVSPVEAALQEQLQLKEKEGLIIISLNDPKLAEKANLKVHDIILGLQKAPDATRPVNVTIIRQGKASQRSLPAVTPTKPYWIGVETANVEEPLRVQLSLTDGKGLLLTGVIKNTPALQAGLRTNDVLIGAEQTDFNKTEDLAKVVQQSEGKPIILRLIRHAKPMTITVTPTLRAQEDAKTQALEEIYRLETSRHYLEQVNSANVITQQLGLRYALPPLTAQVTFEPATVPAQITKLQEELARMTAAAATMQQQLQSLSDQLKQQYPAGKK